MTDEPTPDLRPLHAAMVLILVCAVLAASMFLSAQTGPPLAVEARTAHPPMTWPEPPPAAPGRDAWSTGWPTQRELRAQAYIAAVHQATTTTTTTTPPTTVGTLPANDPPRQSSATLPSNDLEALICSYPWDCATALRVAQCESTMNPGAVSPGGDVGLMQINPVHRGRVAAMGYQWDDLFDPRVNLEVAWSIYAERGNWSPWSCAR